MTLRCLIVDDEPLAQRVIQKYVHELPSLEITAQCKNAFEAMEALQQEDIDLMFLDINMPRLSGMSFLRTLRHPPLVIVTTAHPDHALEGYELDIVDYLKKPFSFERFLKAVQKAQERLALASAAPAYVLGEAERMQIEEGFIFVKEDKRTVRISLKDLLYVESVGDYAKYHLQEGVVLSYQSLKSIEALLPENHFPRIHKSYIIALSKVRAIEGNMVEIGQAKLPIGKTYRSAFMQLIQAYSS